MAMANAEVARRRGTAPWRLSGGPARPPSADPDGAYISFLSPHTFCGAPSLWAAASSIRVMGAQPALPLHSPPKGQGHHIDGFTMAERGGGQGVEAFMKECASLAAGALVGVMGFVCSICDAVND